MPNLSTRCRSRYLPIVLQAKCIHEDVIFGAFGGVLAGLFILIVAAIVVATVTKRRKDIPSVSDTNRFVAELKIICLVGLFWVIIITYYPFELIHYDVNSITFFGNNSF